MVEIKAGPELDRAVAEACGHRVIVQESDWMGFRKGDLLLAPWGRLAMSDSDIKRLPACSTDLNAAFAAAEKVGLFGDPNAMLQRDDEGQWRIRLMYVGGGVMSVQPTPALAICAAILKLKEEK